jgi:hypothetical protein
MTYDTPLPHINGYTQYALFEMVNPLAVVNAYAEELASEQFGESIPIWPDEHAWFYTGDFDEGQDHSFLGLWVAADGEGQFLLVQTLWDDGWKTSEWANDKRRWTALWAFRNACERWSGDGLLVPPLHDDSGNPVSGENAKAFIEGFRRDRGGQFLSPAEWDEITASWEDQLK